MSSNEENNENKNDGWIYGQKEIAVSQDAKANDSCPLGQKNDGKASGSSDDPKNTRIESEKINEMNLSQLAKYVSGEIKSSKESKKESLLQAKKSACHLFYAGEALDKARTLCEKQKYGEWKKWKEENNFAHTTVNDAIRLFKKAKTVEAIAGLGITDAKKKFVYQTKHEKTEIPKKPVVEKEASEKSAKKAFGTNSKNMKPVDKGGQNQPIGPVEQLDPIDEIIETLNSLAQQLTEIAQDRLRKVNLQKADSPRIQTALDAITQGTSKIQERIEHE